MKIMVSKSRKRLIVVDSRVASPFLHIFFFMRRERKMEVVGTWLLRCSLTSVCP